MRAATACSVPGCLAPAAPGSGACDTHRRRTGRPWRRLRSRVVQRERGRCEECGGPARNVHHVDRVELTGREIVPAFRLRLLCDDCAAIADDLFAPV